MKPIKSPSPESISKRVVGGLWVFVLRIISRGIDFIRTIILTRLLDPENFGLLGIALAIATLGTFSHTGFLAALIQKKRMLNHILIPGGRRSTGHNDVSLSKQLKHIAIPVNMFSCEK